MGPSLPEYGRLGFLLNGKWMLSLSDANKNCETILEGISYPVVSCII